VIRVLSPEGEVGTPPAVLASTPTVLAGRRIVVLDNGKPNARLVMEHVARRLAERTGAVVGATVPKRGGAATPAEPDEFAAVRAGADLVLTGSAD
jgi:hypothetical protein